MSPQCLLSLDGFKQGLKIAFAKDTAPLRCMIS